MQLTFADYSTVTCMLYHLLDDNSTWNFCKHIYNYMEDIAIKLIIFLVSSNPIYHLLMNTYLSSRVFVTITTS